MKSQQLGSGEFFFLFSSLFLCLFFHCQNIKVFYNLFFVSILILILLIIIFLNIFLQFYSSSFDFF